MAPSPVTDDYYMVLEVGQTATSELITKSYRRLAREIHPDRNASDGATQAFQLLASAYETLKDETKRREYDLIYPSITRNRLSPQSTQIPRPSPASAPHTDAYREAAQIVVLRNNKGERAVQWRTTRGAFESSIFEQQRCIRRLEQDIKSLASIAAAEKSVEAQKNSWGTWLLTPFYRQRDENEDEKARKDRGRQERRIEKDLKERRLCLQQAQLRKTELSLNQAKRDYDAADLRDDHAIRNIEARMRNREKERLETEMLARIWRQQQEQRETKAQKESEHFEEQQEQARAAAFFRQEENRRRQTVPPDEMTRRGKNNSNSTSACRHGGWWSKLQGRKACPECYDVWPYLLQCPSCDTQACPKCKRRLRARYPRNAARTS